MMKRVAVVGGRPAPVHGARQFGVDVVLVHTPGGYEPEILEHCEQVVHADIGSGPAIVAALETLHRERPFDRIMTTTEVAGESTGYAVDHFGLEGVSEATARILKNKVLMREALSGSGAAPVEFGAVANEEQAAAFVRAHGRSVLKPVDGVASLHIHPAADEAAARAAWRALSAAGVSAVMAEEYLEGPVVSVDSFSFQGRHVPLGYSEYRMNDRYVEWEVSTPSRAAVPWLGELFELVPRLLDAVGLTEGPAHSEFVLTERGPRILESHARLAGSGAPELVRRAFGHDLNRMFLTVPLGIDPLPAGPAGPVAGAAVQFLTPDAGTVQDVVIDTGPGVEVRQVPPGTEPLVFLPFLTGLREADEAVVLQKSVGDSVPELLTVADCVSGYVLVTAKDATAAVTRADALVGQVRIEVGGR